MTRETDDTKPKKPKQSGRRSDRLAAALRENLRRRKAQERQRAAPLAAAPAAKADPAAHDDEIR